jgi:hypothetical protein
MDEVAKVVSEAEKGDVDDAIDNIPDARAEVQKYVEREELSPAVAASVLTQIDRMAAALV